jgi:hypothetical protein
MIVPDLPGPPTGGEDEGSRRAPGGRGGQVCQLPDQVTRRHDFEAAHPDARITFAAAGWMWTGTITVNGHEALVTAHELEELLDQLEELAQAAGQDLTLAEGS